MCVCVWEDTLDVSAIFRVINTRFSIAKLLCFSLHTAKRHLLGKRSGREVGCIQYKPSASSPATHAGVKELMMHIKVGDKRHTIHINHNIVYLC